MITRHAVRTEEPERSTGTKCPYVQFLKDGYPGVSIKPTWPGIDAVLIYFSASEVQLIIPLWCLGWYIINTMDWLRKKA